VSAAVTDAGPKVLDWAEFSAARFPGGRRHDLGALVAYAAYRRAEPQAAASESSALEVWEDEGGPPAH